MTTTRKAAQQALEALEALSMADSGFWHDFIEGPITALRTALAEQPAEREPQSWKHDCAALLTNDIELWLSACPHCGKPRPAPQPTNQPLTSEEIYECERIAAIRHHRHKSSIRGQQITPADDPQWHFTCALIAAYERKNGIGEQP